MTITVKISFGRDTEDLSIYDQYDDGNQLGTTKKYKKTDKQSPNPLILDVATKITGGRGRLRMVETKSGITLTDETIDVWENQVNIWPVIDTVQDLARVITENQ
ncbi:hypothetical protein G6N74_02620 [Mesorhizobium sp. CGMCC 1.15528]|uniref:Uncharacterized protein n=1 Tax=Mesorhizobium zhangyense TaxID=1776730 RepID=A0A7C9V9G2_9HYPH|nr:hypothetical protein [Mesorhizobium zhangyense]NGN39949.1 hypothetical protein [Mesorhizobium zhangyense]